MMAKEKPPITVVGDVGGRIAIIVVRPHVTHIHADFTALETQIEDCSERQTLTAGRESK